MNVDLPIAQISYIYQYSTIFCLLASTRFDIKKGDNP